MAQPENEQYYIFPVVDCDFRPDTEEKCYLLLNRLGELVIEMLEERPELCAARNVWVV